MSLTNIGRAHSYWQFLPKCIQEHMADEEKNWKEFILKELPKAIEQNNIEYIDFIFSVLEVYSAFDTYVFSLEEIQNIAEILYNFIVNYQGYFFVQSACLLFISIIEPKHMKFSITFPWKPVYNLLNNISLSHSKTRLHHYPAGLAETVIMFIHSVRCYFDENAVPEMLNEFLPLLNPKQPSFILGHCLLSLFLPVQYGQHNLWLNKLLNLWTLYRNESFDFQFLSLLVRLSIYGFSDIDWKRIIPYLFSMISIYLQVPQQLLQTSNPPCSNYRPEPYSIFFKGCVGSNSIFTLFSILISNLFSGPTDSQDSVVSIVRENLSRLIHLLSYQCNIHESNSAVVSFLSQLVAMYVHRVKNEAKYGCSFDPKSTYLSPLTQSDHDYFVSLILPLVVMSQYCEEPQFTGLDLIAQLSPSVAIQPLLKAAKSAFEFDHLKNAGYEILDSIAPVILHTHQYEADFMSLFYSSVLADISYMDTDKSSVVFTLLSIVSSFIKFPAEKESFILDVFDKFTEFAKHAIGDDFDPSLAELLTTICHLVRASPSKTVTKWLLKLKEIAQTDEIPPANIGIIIEGLGHFASPIFGNWVFPISNWVSSPNLNDNEILRYFYIIDAISRQDEDFVIDHIDQMIEAINYGIRRDEIKIQRLAISSLKWTLRNMISLYPKIPMKLGIVKLSDIGASIEWHVPETKHIESACKITEYFINVINEFIEKSKHSSDSKKLLKLVSMISHSLLKGLVAGVDSMDVPHLQIQPYQKQPELYHFHDIKLSTLYYKVVQILTDLLDENSNLNDFDQSKTARRIINVLETTVHPRDPIGVNVQDITKEFDINVQMCRLSVLLGQRDSMTYYIAYWKALYIYSIRQTSIQGAFTNQAQEMIKKTIKFNEAHDQLLRESAASVLMAGVEDFYKDLSPIFRDIINKLSAPDITPEALSGYSGATSCFLKIPQSCLDDELMGMLFDAAISVCRLLPKDTNGDASRDLRQLILVLLGQTDPCDPRLEPNDYYELRKRLAITAMSKSAEFAASTEIQNYTIALVCTTIQGNPLLISTDIFEFLCNALPSDDPIVRECVLSMFSIVIEMLIPRGPKPSLPISFYPSSNDPIEFIAPQTVNPENYDQIEFRDRPYGYPTKRIPIFYSRSEMESPSNQFSAVNKLLFSKFIDNTDLLDRLLKIQVNSLEHCDVSFNKDRLNFWSTLCRFFGAPLYHYLFKKLKELTSGSKGNHTLASEMFSGILHSLKSRSYQFISEIQQDIFDFIEELILHVEPEFHNSWYLSFYSPFADMDPRRFFFIFDKLLDLQNKITFENDPIRAARTTSLIVDIASEGGRHFPGLLDKIESIIQTTIFSKELLEYEQVRDCAVRALANLVTMKMNLDERGSSSEISRILNKFVANQSDTFKIQWIDNFFSTQSLASIASSGFAADNLPEFANLLLGKDEQMEDMARSSLVVLSAVNWLGSIPQGKGILIDPKEAVKKFKMIVKNLKPAGQWQVQTMQMLLIECMMSTFFFYMDEDMIEELSEEIAIPGLANSHPDVQDSASELLVSIFKNSMRMEDKMLDFVEKFRDMLRDQELNQRIGGAKGLASVITSALIFDFVPMYVFSAFEALNEALTCDSSVEGVISQFFSDFWSVNESNLLKSAADSLAPFHASLQPSYFC